MLIEKEDGTFIYQSYFAGQNRLIKEWSIKSAIETRENIGRFLFGVVFLAGTAQSNGYGSIAFTTVVVVIAILWACELTFFVRKLPKTTIEATTKEIDKTTIEMIPMPYAYLLLAVGLFGLFFSATLAIPPDEELPIFFPVLLGFISAAQVYISFRLIRGKKSNNSFQG